MSWGDLSPEQMRSIERVTTIAILMILLWRLFEWLR